MRRTLPFQVLPHAIAAAMMVSASAWATDPNCCCTAHATPSCSDTSCSTTVCAIDPYCCSFAWDGTCAYEAAQYCGAAAPYCRDLNQNNVFDVCEGAGSGGGANPADCNGNGTPDLNETGVSGTTQWLGPTNGYGVAFENPQWWNYGRPGTATYARVNVPYTQYYNAFQILMGCDNAVRSFNLGDGGTSVLHDFELNLGGRTLRVAGQFAGFEVNPQIYDTLRVRIASGDIMATDNGLYVYDDGALEVKFDGVDIQGGPFGWSSSLASSSPTLIFRNSTLNTSSFAWPPMIQGVMPYSTLELENSTIQFLPSATGAPPLFAVPNGANLHVTSPGSFDLSKVAGSNVQMYAESGSILVLDGRLTVEGTLSLGGSVIGRSHCLGQAQYCYPSLLTAQTLVYPTPNTKASLTWGVDLSGASGTTLDGDASIRVTGGAWIDGTLIVNDLSNGTPPALDFTVPLVSAATYSVGHDNFDMVRAYGMDYTPLPAGYFVTTQRVGSEINLVVKRANPVASTSPVSSTLTTTPTKMVVVDDGTRFGLPLVAYASPAGTQSTAISLRKINAAQGTVSQFGMIYAPADLTDMIAADVTGDGVPELIASFGSSRQVRAYVVSSAPTLLWTSQLPTNVRPECLCELKPNGQRLMPTGSSVGVGTSFGSKGGVGTIGSTGVYTDAGEVAVIPRTVNGTDVDNDDDSDVVAGGESTSSALTGSPVGAIQIIRREATGGFTKLPPVTTPGIPTALAVADLDGDGRKDVVASCNQLTDSYGIGMRPTGVVLRGAPSVGNGSTPSLLRTPVALDVGSSYAQGTGVALVDADGDGSLDIVLSWQDTGSTTSGGAVIFPVRDQRTSGGLSLGGQLNFAFSAVSQLRRLNASSVVTLRAANQSFVGGTSLVQDDFAAAPIEGDLDGDGFVGTSDVALLLLDFGPCTVRPCEGDLDGDGVVGTGDLAYLLLLFS